MALREDLLAPIAGDNPSGVDVRYDTKLLLYDKIKEARRQDDELAQGAWQHERKMADYKQVVRLAQEALATRTKDLQLAAWLTEALLHTDQFGGLRQGLVLCHGLVSTFWDTLYPPAEDGDLELRAAPLEWLGVSLELPIKMTPLNQAGHHLLQYKDSRLVGYEADATNDKDKKARAKKITEGKLAPEDFDKSCADTPKAFYLQSEKDLDSCLEALRELEELCNKKFGDVSPSFGKVKIALEEVRHSIHGLLQKKRETEPDPVEEVPAPPAVESGAAAETPAAAPGIGIPHMASAEPADRQDAINSVAKAAAFLRKRDPQSPAPYLMMRGLRWGELRQAAKRGDATQLEGPPTELRQHIKRLALNGKWAELLESGESAMALPCSRGWLDLQRYVVDACTALGSGYELIASAIRSELRALIMDIPQLLDSTLLDDTPVANAETKAWLQRLMEGPPETVTVAADGSGAPEQPDGKPASSSMWRAKDTDPYSLAQEALKAGQAEKAFDIIRREIANQRSGRGRFQRTLQLVQLCVAAGKEAIAQPLLDDLMAAIESHKLDDWEDKQMVASVLAIVMTSSKKIQGNAGERQKLFDRICRLDPVRALGTSG